ncbi:MAG: class I SAM-dependent methyltransferase [Candidatus Yanofskybacteria bacterium]|nr:class I SAM-dependent methyltransferase [Candidatus Yanofskybacteria bacterium]
MFKPFRCLLEKYLPARIEAYAERQIKAHRVLREYLEYYRERSPATGCSYSDYQLLYTYIKKHKPTEVLECGTGFSTLVIMQALKENEEEHGIRGHLVSMEESEQYYKAAIENLPADLKNDQRLEIIWSPAIEDAYDFFQGVRYRDVPKRKYDFVYVDGPTLMIGSDKKIRTFTLDFVNVVLENEHPVSALIDTRKRTCFIYSLLFPKKFRYDYMRYVGIVEGATKNDLANGKIIAERAVEQHIFRRPALVKSITGRY